MRPAIALIGLIVFAVVLSAMFSKPVTPGSDANAADSAQTSQPTPPPTSAVTAADAAKQFDAVKAGAVHATMTIEGRGALQLELYPAAAPQTVAHFVELAKKGFYNGQLFHRYEPGFVIQGGDPASKKVKPSDIANMSSGEAGQKFGLGKGGSGTTVPLEAKLPHVRNSLGLARSQDRNSGDSQFFINLSDNDKLNPMGYTVFGRVVGGELIVPTLRQGDRITSITID